MKKLLLILSATAGVALLLMLFPSSNDVKQLTRETPLTGKDATTAKKFTHFIHKYAKTNRIETFKKRFRGIPPESAQQVWETLVSIEKINKPVKVTVPATGKTRRCVYYQKDNKSYYKFVVNSTKKQWLFQELAEVKINN